MTYSIEYIEQVEDLYRYFREAIKDFEPLKITDTDWSSGPDALPEPFQHLIKAAFDQWLSERKYELSYNQIAQAMMYAGLDTGILIRL